MVITINNHYLTATNSTKIYGTWVNIKKLDYKI